MGYSTTDCPTVTGYTPTTTWCVKDDGNERDRGTRHKRMAMDWETWTATFDYDNLALEIKTLKKITVYLILIVFATFTLSAQESDVIVQAQNDAVEDGQNFHAFWWGAGGAATTALPVVLAAFFGGAISVEARRTVALAAPVVGGTSLALICFFTGKSEVPDARIDEIQNEYNDSRLLSLYESEYEKTLTKIQRRKRGNAALIGAGVSVGVMGLGFLVVYLSK